MLHFVVCFGVPPLSSLVKILSTPLGYRQREQRIVRPKDFHTWLSLRGKAVGVQHCNKKKECELQEWPTEPAKEEKDQPDVFITQDKM